MSYTSLITTYGYTAGYVIFFLIIFAESGLFFGFFFPGDSLLLPLGILAFHGQFNLALIILIGSVASFLGNAVGYGFGRRFGPTLFNRKDSLFLKKDNIAKAHDFYQKYGKAAIILARFTPVIRTFAPIIAGMAEMDYPTFMFFNALGGVLWVTSVTLIGYFLGSRFPFIANNITTLSIAVVVISILPYLFHIVKTQLTKKNV
jgi:membrane-associated protein